MIILEIMIFIFLLALAIYWILFPFFVLSRLDKILDCLYRNLEKSRKSRQSTDS